MVVPVLLVAWAALGVEVFHVPVFDAMALIGSFSVLVGIPLYCVMKARTGIHGPGVSTFPFESVARVVKPGREDSGV